MEVYLKRNWFAPDGHLYPKALTEKHTVNIPDNLKAALPTDAVIKTTKGTGDKSVVNEPDTFSSLKDFDLARAAVNAEEKVLKELNKRTQKA